MGDCGVDDLVVVPEKDGRRKEGSLRVNQSV